MNTLVPNLTGVSQTMLLALHNRAVEAKRRDGVLMDPDAATWARDERGSLFHKAGVMGIEIVSGEVRPGDAIAVALPAPRTAR